MTAATATQSAISAAQPCASTTSIGTVVRPCRNANTSPSHGPSAMPYSTDSQDDRTCVTVTSR